MKKLFIGIIIMISVVIISSILLPEENSNPLTRHLNVDDLRNEGLNYLNSFDDVALDISDHDSTFSATKSVGSLFGVNLLNTTQTQMSEYFISFEATYVQEIGIVFMKVNLNNATGSVDQINVIGYPFFNEALNQVDISFEYFGEKLLASDLLNKTVDQQFDSNRMFLVLADAGGGSSNPPVVNVTMPVLQISIAIINAGDNLIQEGINNLQQVAPVDFWRDGPLHYILWYVKAQKAIDNYNHNKNLAFPSNALTDGYINRQSGFTNWKFGFQSFDQNGCGVISLYNLLVSQDRAPNLPSLILLSELMNADLGLGFLGLNPISNDLMKLVADTVNTVFVVMQPLLHIASPVIAGIITERLISDQLNQATKWWQDMLIWASMPAQYTITLAAVNAAIIAAVAVVDLVTDFYIEHLHGIPDVLNVLGYESLDVSYLSYDNFNNGRSAHGYFIITFFNTVPNFSNLQSFSAHTVFVKRDKQNEDAMTAYNNNTRNSNNFYGFYTSNHSTRNTQFISGITVKG